MITQQFWDELDQFDNIYCLISGGWHSTVIALILHEKGYEVTLVHNNTMLQLPFARKTMKKIREQTGFDYIETKPKIYKGLTVMDIIRQSIERIPEVMEDVKMKRYDRSKFKCCYHLKKRPGKLLYRMIDKENSVIISGMTPYESNQRRWRFYELRQWDTYVRFHKTNDAFHIYPFRDCFKAKPFQDYLQLRGYGDTKHSGCIICPILIVFGIWDDNDINRYEKTKRFTEKMMGMSLEEFIKENKEEM